ncbi:MAG: efflux RND transporter permease subunit [Myxococcota bacterium]|nr:efflux RND transporter permease subunit [Myxococcota bacterium]
MIDKLINWSLEKRFFVIVAAAALLGLGIYRGANIKVDVFPDLTAPTVTILTDAHGMATQEVERSITFPIEAVLNGVANVRRVRSISDVGSSVIWVEFDWGADIYRARQVVAEKLQLVRESLPEQASQPVIAPITSIMGEVMFIALTGDEHSLMDLRTQADWVVKRRLLAVPGVSQVICIGGQVKQFQVLLDPSRLVAYGLSAAEVVAALRESNENTSAGFFEEGGLEHVIHGVGRIARIKDLEQTVIAVRDKKPVLVRDVGRVIIGPALRRGAGSYNGEPAVVLGIQKQPTANTLELNQRLDAVIEDLRTSLPTGITIERNGFRQADFIEVALANISAAIRDGSILVVFIILVFVMSLRSTLITALAIPLSLITALLVLEVMGATINTMTLGGMAIAVGALVDDAIIGVENTVRRLRQDNGTGERTGPSLMKIVFGAISEIRNSIVFATLIIMLVFLPLFFLTGVEGRLLMPLGQAYIISLFASLLVALTVTPALSLWLLPRSRTVMAAREPLVVVWLKRAYAPLLTKALKHWKSVAIAAGGLLIGAGGAVFFAGQAFLPDFNEGALTLSTVTLPGTNLTASEQLGRLVEQTLLNEPEVLSTTRRQGRDDLDEHGMPPSSAEIDVTLEMGDRSKGELLGSVRESLSAIPGLTVIIGQPISHRIDHMLSGTRASIAVKIFGPELFVLRDLAEQVQTAMQDIPGVVDLSKDQQADIPFVTVSYDRPAIARHGLKIQDVSHAIETAFRGEVVTEIREEQASFGLLVRYEADQVESLETMRELLIATPTGPMVPLHALAHIQRDVGPNMISREHVQRKAVVSCNVANRDLQAVVDDIRWAVQGNVTMPPGYHVAYGGQFESAERATRTLGLLGVLVVAGIFLLLFIAFGSIRDAALVMLNLPLALIGGVIGVFVCDGVITIASIIGFISLFGIATRNGIMMITHIRNLVEQEGMTDVASAVRRGAEERLIPILMTALASGLGLLPLALAQGEPGSEIQAPMAIVILFGLMTATVLNMIVVPALYQRVGSIAKRSYGASIL